MTPQPMARFEAARIPFCFALIRFENRARKPGPAFNVAMASAFADGADYLYRSNDDTAPGPSLFVTPNILLLCGGLYGELYGRLYNKVLSSKRSDQIREQVRREASDVQPTERRCGRTVRGAGDLSSPTQYSYRTWY
jgi:hypothetical protein